MDQGRYQRAVFNSVLFNIYELLTKCHLTQRTLPVVIVFDCRIQKAVIHRKPSGAALTGCIGGPQLAQFSRIWSIRRRDSRRWSVL